MSPSLAQARQRGDFRSVTVLSFALWPLSPGVCMAVLVSDGSFYLNIALLKSTQRPHQLGVPPTRLLQPFVSMLVAGRGWPVAFRGRPRLLRARLKVICKECPPPTHSSGASEVSSARSHSLKLFYLLVCLFPILKSRDCLSCLVVSPTCPEQGLVVRGLQQIAAFLARK